MGSEADRCTEVPPQKEIARMKNGFHLDRVFVLAFGSKYGSIGCEGLLTSVSFGKM